MITLKVQRYLAGNDTHRPWIFRDQKRKVHARLPEADIPEDLHALMTDVDILFCEANVYVRDGITHIDIHQLLPNEAW